MNKRNVASYDNRRQNALNADKREEECSICLISTVNNGVIRKLRCGHRFHNDCVDNWFSNNQNNKNCPVCRTRARQ